MISNFRQLAVLNKIFNIRKNEWSRVLIAWVIRFLYRLGFVLGWTVVVGLFVSKFGIYFLPYLFVLNAVFSILGTFFYTTFLGRFKTVHLMIGTVFAAVLVLFLAYNLASFSEIGLFGLLVVAISIFLKQFKILFEAYVEEMFTPLESERVFPLIEAADTIGGILAGFLIVLISSDVDVFNFINLWIALLLLIVPAILLYGLVARRDNLKRPEPVPETVDLGEKNVNVAARSFVKGLFVLVFLQWLIFNILEFQYTRAVYQNVSNAIVEAGSGFEHAFVHDLGVLFMLFSFSALLIQLFLGSRLINYLGVVGVMILHAVVTFFSFFGLTISSNFYTAVLAKNNFTMTSILNTSAYHSSFYALRENVRFSARELLEGIVKPVGAIVGMCFLIVLQKFLTGVLFVFVTNTLMLVSSLFLFYFAYLQQSRYTAVVVDDLINSRELKVRLNAVNVLAQKGHKSSFELLRKIVKDKNEPELLRVKILEAFAELNCLDALETITDCLKNANVVIRDAALNSLLNYDHLGNDSKKILLARLKLLKTIKFLYKCETDNFVRSKIVKLLSKVSNMAAVEFLLSILKSSNDEIKADAILALKSFDDDSLSNVVEPFLKSDNLKQKAAAIVVLTKFGGLEKKVNRALHSLIDSDLEDEIAAAMFALGELGAKTEKSFCVNFVDSKNLNLKSNAAFALAKMGYSESIPALIELLFSGNFEIARQTKHLLENVDVRISKNVDKIIRQLISDKPSLVPVLQKLQWLYCPVEEYATFNGNSI